MDWPLPLCFRELTEQVGLFEELFQGCLAIDLEDPDLRHVLFETALDATFVESEELQVAAFGNPDPALRQCSVHSGVAGSDFVGLSDPLRKNRRLQTCRMVKSPSVVGQPAPS